MVNSLTEIPEVPQKLILDKLDFPAILSLHKTCIDYRNLIEDYKPGKSELQIQIDLKKESIDYKLSWPADPRSTKTMKMGWNVRETYKNLNLSYSNLENGCQIIWKKEDLDPRILFNVQKPKTKILKDQKFLPTFLKDFQILMDLQRTTVIFRKFELNVQENCEEEAGLLYLELEKIFRKNRGIKIRKLQIQTFGNQGVLAILPFVNPENLERISIENAKKSEEFLEKMEEIMESEQWKMAKNVDFRRFVVPWKLEKYLNFESFSINIPRISNQDMVDLRNSILIGAKFKTFGINFQILEDDYKLLESEFGRNMTTPQPELSILAAWEWKFPEKKRNFVAFLG
ncbi:Protein CBG24802, partial [Caenorhabditis briggsae]